jgi:hypothetical protein
MSKYIKSDRAKALTQAGYSLLVAGQNKQPIHPWKACQTAQMTEADLNRSMESGNAWRFGYCCGFNGVFCVDIDLKVLPMELRAPMWDEFIQFVRDNIDSFDRKVSVHKTLNFGYHLTYRTDTDMGNEKIAVPCKSGILKEGAKVHEALIETRGRGGYAVVYDECVNGLDYTEIGHLSAEEHNAIINIARIYDERVAEAVPESPKPERDQTGLTPWADYNQRHSIFDLIGDEFKVVRNLANKTVIKRHGATSPHSGYVFRDSGCMYLFSTGTRYPHQKLLSAFGCFAIRYHNGDMSAAAKALYADGYGDRVRRPLPELPKKEVIQKPDFPIDIFPDSIQRYMMECNRTLDSTIDYMGAGLVWALSAMIGNSIKIEVKSGWVESVTVWICVVGKAGVGKSPSVNNIIRPLLDANSREIREYQRKYRDFKEYDNLSDKDKKNAVEVKEPQKKQFIVNDVTLEALVELHEQNPSAIGVFKDELAGWIKDMNKYRAGSDVEFWLSSFSNSPVALNRKTVKNTYVHSPLIPVLGGIQPAVLNEAFTPEFKDNGFTDRMLLAFPDVAVEHYNVNELSVDLLKWYNDWTLNLYQHIKKDIATLDADGEVKPHVVRFTQDASQEWARVFNKITDLQNSENESEYTKSMLPKQKTYVPRFALILSVLEAWDNGEYIVKDVDADAVRRAERLSDYFIRMAKKVKADSSEYQEMKKATFDRSAKTEFEQFRLMYEKDPDLNRSHAADILNKSRQTIKNWIKELNNEAKRVSN